MSKALDDLAGRLQGVTAGLVGMKDKVSKPAEGEPPPPPAPTPSQEDVAKYKQMIAEAKGVIEGMEAEMEKEAPKSVETTISHGTTASRKVTT
jgi:hypothetical protein